MIKKTIKFTDLDGNEVVEDFYFHMTKAELAEMEALHPEGLRNHLMSIVAKEDRAKILKAFKDIIAMTVGKRGDDGRQFVKSPEITNAFMNSDAYSELVISFFQTPGLGADFVAGVMPADLVSKIDMAAITADVEAGNLKKIEEVMLPGDPAPKKIGDYTERELIEMPEWQFRQLLDSAKGGNIPHTVLQVAMRKATNQ